LDDTLENPGVRPLPRKVVQMKIDQRSKIKDQRSKDQERSRDQDKRSNVGIKEK
jgi:hypothetical protein